MKTSRKTDYAIHALMILARNKNEKVSVKQLMEQQNISKSYLAKVMQKLSSAQIVESSEGKYGGYRLVKKPGEIRLSEIVTIMEEGRNIFNCVDEKRGCNIKDRCKIHKVFKKAYQNMLKDLEKTSIKDILDPELHT
jgi:Rrf2 family protein